MARNSIPARGVLRSLLRTHRGRLLPHAVRISTPVPTRVPLAGAKLGKTIAAFVSAYEPRTATEGLYRHQSEALSRLDGAESPNVVLTSATGTGKSLVFWSWVVARLSASKRATALACFPTQALLWGQADRLARISDPDSLVRIDGQVYAGTIVLGGTKLPWTVWHGVGESAEMREHQGSEAFARARIRIATLDKAHWSLMHVPSADFLRELSAVVLDEAHEWHGYAGASVRRFADRVAIALALEGREPPGWFVASATLSQPAEFAAMVTGAEVASFLAVEDSVGTRIELVELDSVVAAMSTPPGDALERYAVLFAADQAPTSADLLRDGELLGGDANLLCFVESKFAGKCLARDVDGAVEGRTTTVYDADLTAKDRRAIERRLFDGRRGQTIVGTSALELGIDLPDLDVVIVDEVPATRASLVQRIGRAGRTVGRPGLAIIRLDGSPADLRVANDAVDALTITNARPLPIPLHLESVQLRAMRAAFDENRARIREVGWPTFNDAMKACFGESPSYAALEERIEHELRGVVDLDEGSWWYRGFRVSASLGKRRLVLRDSREAVAQVDDVAVFRDAHPEAVYLGHRGERYRVVGYRGSFRMGRWTHPDSDVVLGKWMHALRDIIVVPERRAVTTRGQWRDTITLEELREANTPLDGPASGVLERGVFSFRRKFDGYVELDLRGKRGARRVSLAEVSERFRQAIDDGGEFPFLHQFSYRTLGFRWSVAAVLPDRVVRAAIAPALAAALRTFFCDALECALGDLQVSFSPVDGELRVIDAMPGGNGLSAALLQHGRLATALARLRSANLETVLADTGLPLDDLPRKELADAFDRLARAWSR